MEQPISRCPCEDLFIIKITRRQIWVTSPDHFFVFVCIPKVLISQGLNPHTIAAIQMEHNHNRFMSGAYTEIVIRGDPGVEVEVNLASARGASHYRPRGFWGHAPPGKFLKYLSQMAHYKSIRKVICEQKHYYCCSKILHSSVNLVYYLEYIFKYI